MAPGAAFRIQSVRTTADIEAVRQLFLDYATSLGVDLSFQDFDEELTALPGRYAPPTGELLLARNAYGKPIGCVALRAMDKEGVVNSCEMKRLYVAPEGRGIGLGKALIDATVRLARRAGYAEMRLDTLPNMAQAIHLYKEAGFEAMTAYYETPLAETLFFRRMLVP
ncbi:MAG TPA: GNAT family N-acetyltransferase [Acidobacteriaceae bacterium]|nr:GNAT family N-acetyltransferase [Acidobacteriaceae bacterium]